LKGSKLAATLAAVVGAGAGGVKVSKASNGANSAGEKEEENDGVNDSAGCCEKVGADGAGGAGGDVVAGGLKAVASSKERSKLTSAKDGEG
jgi:hypothetical protein